jgi:hypothetical protein
MMAYAPTVHAHGDWTCGLKLPKRQGVNDLDHTKQRSALTGFATIDRAVHVGIALRPVAPGGQI